MPLTKKQLEAALEAAIKWPRHTDGYCTDDYGKVVWPGAAAMGVAYSELIDKFELTDSGRRRADDGANGIAIALGITTREYLNLLYDDPQELASRLKALLLK